MEITVKSLVNWKFFLLVFVLSAGLVFFSSHQVAHAQSECTDPATGLPCAPAPTCGVPGTLPCEPPPPTSPPPPSGCTDAAGNACTPVPPPPSNPDPTRTPQPRPTNTPLPTVTAIQSCDTNFLTAVLTGANVVPAVTTEGQGIVKLLLDVNNGTIIGNWQISNLSGSITAAHIHKGAAGVNAGVFIPFSSLPLGGSFATVNSAQTAKLQAFLDDPSAYYVNIHSAAYPGGEIRGQLACAPAEPIASPTPTATATATATPTDSYKTVPASATPSPTSTSIVAVIPPAGSGTQASGIAGVNLPLILGIPGGLIIMGLVWFAVRSFGDGSVREKPLINDQLKSADGSKNFVKMTSLGESNMVKMTSPGSENFMKEVRDENSFGDSLLNGGMADGSVRPDGKNDSGTGKLKNK